MKLTIEGNINAYYVQTLCMIFFPGAKFSEKDTGDDSEPELYIKTDETGDGASAYAVMRNNGKQCAGSGYAAFENGVPPQRSVKIAAGRAVFAAGKEMFGIAPPWGILTGVRPSKVPMEFLLAGKGINETKQILRSEYFLSQKKASLVTSVASYEARLTKKLQGNLCSVYISIPFCPSRCAYCSFVSFTSAKLLTLVGDYLLQLEKEITALFRLIRELGLKVATVYIGGGTPTVLDLEQLEFLLSAVARNTDVSSLMEYTLEAGRPDTITREKLALSRDYGVTRISVNPQSLSDAVLEAIGRKHTVLEFFGAYDIARASGIRDINVDLIAGLPGDNFTRFSRSVDRVAELKPENITIHTFSVKKSSDILRANSDIYRRGPTDTAKCVDYSQLKMRNDGYRPYYMYRQKNTVENLENVGYTLEGHEGMYNIFMMEEYHSIFSAGAGAVTKLVDYRTPKDGGSRIARIFNPKYPYEYLRDAPDSDAIFEKLYSEYLKFTGATQSR